MSRSTRGKSVALKGLPPSVWARLERRARATGRSLTATAVDALRRGLGEASDAENSAAEAAIAVLQSKWRRAPMLDVVAAIREDRRRR